MNRKPPSLVVDASVLINLTASLYADRILRALPERVLMVDVVRGELDAGASRARNDAVLLDELVASGLVEMVSLGDVGDAIFERLTGGSTASTLDDGEAATIAYAVESSLGVVLDDKKARRICGDDFPAVPLRCSCDFFRSPDVVEALGQEQLAAALFNALRNARMRVLPEYMEWVVQQIGLQEASRCSCLRLPTSARPSTVAQ